MSIARRDWVAERQGREAHRPVLAKPSAANSWGAIEEIQDHAAPRRGGALGVISSNARTEFPSKINDWLRRAWICRSILIIPSTGLSK
jgi:hypothetical protein